LLGIQDPALVLLELRGYVAFGVHQRLLALVVGGHRADVRAAHLNVVAEDLVEADLERLDPGPLPLGLLQPGDPLPRLTGRSAQAVELGAEPGADCRPAPEDGRRL